MIPNGTVRSGTVHEVGEELAYALEGFLEGYILTGRTPFHAMCLRPMDSTFAQKQCLVFSHSRFYQCLQPAATRLSY